VVWKGWWASGDRAQGSAPLLLLLPSVSAASLASLLAVTVLLIWGRLLLRQLVVFEWWEST
jgi:hypothetical protein